jgi:hypothetical protein
MIKLAFLFLVFVSNLYAGTIDPVVSDKKYIEYGSKFECVGIISGVYNNDQQFMASGVAIDNHHVLTAAHVVKNSVSCRFITSDGREICLNKVIYHKDFIEKNYGFFDIAICFSEEPINLNSYPDLYTNNDEVEKICSIAGYGFYGTFETGAINIDNKKRAGLNIIDSIDNHLLVCTPSYPDDAKKTKLEFIIATGDSGGGLFIGEKLAGINSCIMAKDKKPNSSYTDESGHTRISQFVDWIIIHKSK